jgi:hypothetical protein
MPFSDVTTASDPPYGDTGPRRVNGKIVPRHLLVFKTGDKMNFDKRTTQVRAWRHEHDG